MSCTVLLLFDRLYMPRLRLSEPLTIIRGYTARLLASPCVVLLFDRLSLCWLQTSVGCSPPLCSSEMLCGVQLNVSSCTGSSGIALLLLCHLIAVYGNHRSSAQPSKSFKLVSCA